MVDYMTFENFEMPILWFFDILNTIFSQFEYISTKFQPSTVTSSKNHEI